MEWPTSNMTLFARCPHSSPLTTASYTSQLRSILLELDGCRWYRLWCSEQQGTLLHRHINRPSKLTSPFARSVSPVERVSISSQMKPHIALLRMLSIPRSIPSAHSLFSPPFIAPSSPLAPSNAQSVNSQRHRRSQTSRTPLAL